MLSFGAEDATAIAMACTLDFAFPEITERVFVGNRSRDEASVFPTGRDSRLASVSASASSVSTLFLPTFAYNCRHCWQSNHLDLDKYTCTYTG